MLRLTYERERRGWPKAKLARRARLDQATVSRIEAGRVRPYAVELRRLARALGLAVTEAEGLLQEVHETSPREVAERRGCGRDATSRSRAPR